MQYHVDNGSTTAEPESSIPSVLEEYGGGGAVESTQTGRSRPAHSDSWEGMRRRVMTCMEHPSSVQRPASSVQRPASSTSISIHQGSRCDPAASWYPDLPDPEIHRAHLGARTRLSKSLFAAMTSPAAGITFKVHPHQMPSLRQKARNDTMASRESGQWHASPIAQCHAKPDRGTEGPLASPRCADGGVENPASRRQKPSSSTGLGADGLLCDHWENRERWRRVW